MMIELEIVGNRLPPREACGPHFDNNAEVLMSKPVLGKVYDISDWDWGACRHQVWLFKHSCRGVEAGSKLLLNLDHRLLSPFPIVYVGPQ
jgi:hypothetical protein